MSAITDDEIAQHPIPGPHGSRRWCCDECSWKYEERLRERVRADAATIAELRGQVAKRDATIERVHAIADKECSGPHPVQSAEESLTFIERELFRRRVALERINEIRNDIVGRQNVTWSLHIYPLVAALNDAGYVSADYKTARANIVSANATIARLRAVARAARENMAAVEAAADTFDLDAIRATNDGVTAALSALAPGDMGKDGE